MGDARDFVRRFVLRYVKAKPTRISLSVDWKNSRSVISVHGENLKESVERSEWISFTSFAEGVLDAFREAYGELKAVPVSFREEIYENDHVSLDLYPTGSMGIFDIYITYKH
jgi:hypothetical protein